MDKNKTILIAIVILVIILAAVVLAFNVPQTAVLNSTEENITADVTNATNVTVESEDIASQDVLNSTQTPSSVDEKIDNKTLENTGWQWSEQEQGYVHQFVDSDGDLHIQTATTEGIRDLEFKSDGTVYRDGKDVTERYYRDFS